MEIGNLRVLAFYFFANIIKKNVFNKFGKSPSGM